MTPAPEQTGARAARNWRPAALLLAGFVLANFVRVAVGGPGVAYSATAGWVFALALALLVFAWPSKPSASPRAVLIGLGGAAVLCVPVVIQRLIEQEPAARPGGSFFSWALVVSAVAVAEEAFLRGSLYDAMTAAHSEWAAVLVTSAAFALLHVPLYGWHVVPLDLAVGVWLAALRRGSGGWTAPAVAHTGADFAAWWLR